LEALGIPTEGLADRLCAGPVGWALDGLTCTACGTALETLFYQIQSAPEEKARLIQWVARLKPQEGDEKAPPAIELIRLHQAIKTQNITTIEELEAALDELRQVVQAALETGKRVILV